MFKKNLFSRWPSILNGLNTLNVNCLKILKKHHGPHKSGHMSPAGRVLETPELESSLYISGKRSEPCSQGTEKSCGCRFEVPQQSVQRNILVIVSMERNPFSAKNHTLRSNRVYILPTKQASSAL